MHWNGDWYMGWMGLWWILILVALVAVAWFAVTAARRRDGNRGPTGGESPEQALKRRYANGEIDRSTYERMLEDLRR